MDIVWLEHSKRPYAIARGFSFLDIAQQEISRIYELIRKSAEVFDIWRRWLVSLGTRTTAISRLVAMKEGNKFTLTVPKGTSQKVIVQVRFTLNGVSRCIGSGVKVPRAAWDSKSKRVSARNRTISVEAATLLNSQLQQVLTDLNAFALRRHANGQPITPELLKRVVAGGDIQVDEPTVTFAHVFEEFYHDLLNRSAANNTLISYRNTARLVATWESKLKVEDFDSKRAGQFVRSLTDSGKKNSYVRLCQAHLKTILKYAYDQNLTKADHFRRFGNRVRTVNTNSNVIWLNELQVKKIATLDLTSDQKLAETQAAFLLQCYVGCRYSDLPKIKKAAVTNGKIIYTTRKTFTRLRVPLRPEAWAIIQAYPDGVPMPSQHSVYLDRIRVVASKAGLDSPVIVENLRGNRIESIEKPLYQTIGSHTGRRSFCGNTLAAGMSPQELIKYTGHRDIRTLMIYVNANADQVDEKFQRLFGVAEAAD